MRYQAVEFQFGPETLSRIGDDWFRRWQETMDDAQDTLSQAIAVENPMDAWSLQLAFGMRNAQRWFGWADLETIASEPAAAAAADAAAETDAAADGEDEVMEAAPAAPAEVPAPEAVAPESVAVEPEAPAVDTAPAPVVEPVEAELALEAPAEPVVAEPVADELQRIRGIGPAIERKLAVRGITRFADIAALDADAIAVLDEELDLKGRIERDEWVGQAQALADRV
ncbi:MAG: hypothetical protein H6844_13670 [Alphaproteobacteria bacterium]|nr:hypothetical protein [Alphaproteobacteria bacterium]